MYFPYNSWGHAYSATCPCHNCKQIGFWEKFRTDISCRRKVFAMVDKKIGSYEPSWWDKIKLSRSEDYQLWWFREHILKPMAREAGDAV